MKKSLKVSLFVIGGIILLPIIIIGASMLYLFFSDFSNANHSNDESANNWKVGHYVDSFDEPTGDKYIRGVFPGKFSNSATTDSPLKVEVYVDADSTVIFRFWEYESRLVKDEEGAIVIAKDGNGETHRWESDLHGFNDIDHNGNFKSPYLYGYPKGLFWQIIDKGGIPSFVIYVGKYSKSDYKFSIDTQGLKEQLKKISADNTNMQ